MGKNTGRQGNKPINGNGEPNELTGELGKANQINGGGHDDTITGGDQIDYINAGGGDDFIIGDPGADEGALLGGDDIIHAGGGNDTVYAGAGDDEVKGQGGSDTLDGGDGHDIAGGYDALYHYDLTFDSPGDATTLSGVSDTRDPFDADTLSNFEEVHFEDYTLYLDGTNNNPYAVMDSATLTEDEASVDIDVLANDLEFDGETLAVTGLIDDSSAGDGFSNVTDNGDGTFTFSTDGAYDWLAAGESTTETFTYGLTDGSGLSTDDVGTVEVTITGVNDGPDAVDDDNFAAVAEETAVDLDVLANDTDPDLSDTLEVVEVEGQDITSGSVTLASGAVVSLNPDGTLNYDLITNDAFDELNAGEFDTDSFEYTVSDGNGGFDTATVSLDISGVDDFA